MSTDWGCDWAKNAEKPNAHFRFLAALAFSWRPWRPKIRAIRGLFLQG